jgi:flagellar FliL protein
MAAEETEAATSSARQQPAPAAPKKTSMVALIAEFAILTGFAVGAGGLFGMQMLGSLDHGGVKPEAVATKASKPKHAEGSNLKPLPTIVTNLASPKGVWIRIEASIVVGPEATNTNALAASISEDMIAYLRTVPLEQLEGPSGFLHLREDINDRARIRSGGKVGDIVLHAVVLE